MTICSKIIRFLGWTPVGKEVQIEIDDSEFPKLNGKVLLGKITSLTSNEVGIFSEYGESIAELKDHSSFIITARHGSYDLFHLRAGGVAVSLSLARKSGVNVDARFARGLMKLYP